MADPIMIGLAALAAITWLSRKAKSSTSGGGFVAQNVQFIPNQTVSADQITSDAVAMNESLKNHGYKAYDMALYQAVQRDAGLKDDGYPGTDTMNALGAVLVQQGIPVANVKVYPWRAGGGWDGVNAPLLSEWNG